MSKMGQIHDMAMNEKEEELQVTTKNSVALH